MPGGATAPDQMSPTLTRKDSELSRQIQLAYSTGKSLKVLLLVKDARKSGGMIETEDCETALMCAAKLACGKNSSPSVLIFSEHFSAVALPPIAAVTQPNKWGSLADLYELTMDMLSLLRDRQSVSYEAYLAAMKVHTEAKRPASALSLMEEIKERITFKSVDSIKVEYIKALCSAASPDVQLKNPKDRNGLILLGLEAYEAYREAQRVQGLTSFDDSTYVAAANAYAFMLGPQTSSKRLIIVLKDMMNEGFEPRMKMCRSILTSALRYEDAEVRFSLFSCILI